MADLVQASTPAGTNTLGYITPVADWDQVVGHQPPWITGSFPGADWSSYCAAGFLLPYADVRALNNLGALNNQVIEQDWAKYYTETSIPNTNTPAILGSPTRTYQTEIPLNLDAAITPGPLPTTTPWPYATGALTAIQRRANYQAQLDFVVVQGMASLLAAGTPTPAACQNLATFSGVSFIYQGNVYLP